jgi:Tetratricopeptide repeat
MPSIGQYADTVTLLLVEGAKYLGVLAVCVVAIRLWRRLSQVTGTNRHQTFALALVTSVLAGTLGYVSLSHSLGRMYYSYATRAFYSGKVPAALSLFRTAQGYWKSADSAGGEGVCLLLLGQPSEGIRRLEWAAARRDGKNSSFELHYTGIYYFFQGKSSEAIPLLQASAYYPEYTWDADKLLAVAFLDQGRSDEAARLMEPFASVEVKECDHAYVLASLKVLQNKPSEARALLDRFPDDQLNGFWKPRFDKLRVKSQSLASS